ncbi:MAG: MIP/aquaporin family protein [Ktedonobacterales bacterium]
MATETSASEGRKEAREQYRFAAEVIALFIYVFLGAGVESFTRVAAFRAHRPLDSTYWLLVGFAHGIALYIAIVTTRWVAGAHANPAVTFGLAVSRRFAWKQVPQQVAAQFLGAVLGALAVLIVFGRITATAGHLGAAELAPSTSLIQAFFIEALGTSILALAIIATNHPGAPTGWGALTAGMSVLVIPLYLGPATSALVNPARAFGPDLVDLFAGVPVNWAVFVVADLLGPLVGAAIACLLYVRVSARRPLTQ